MVKPRAGRIYVLAGANGAGKSTVGGAAFRAQRADYFNPDEATRRYLESTPGCSLEDANIAAWNEGKRLLERAISERSDFAFETTLGGNTIPALLKKAAIEGLEVRVWYAALSSADLHVARVRSRVKHGGHDIPEMQIRERYDRSRVNLIELMPVLTELLVYDNSSQGDPAEGRRPQPKLVLHMEKRKILKSCDLADAPFWSKPILATALKTARH